MTPGIEGMDIYLLRTPRLPLATLGELNQCFHQELLDAYFLKLFSDPELVDAICIASEELGRQLVEWLKSPLYPLSPKVRLSLFKYVLRMSARSTPFGKFSGISLGEFSEYSRIELSGQQSPHVRFDMGFSGHVAKTAMSQSSIRHSLEYTVNNSLFEQGEQYRFIERKEGAGRRSYQWTKVTKNPILQSVLEIAKAPIRFNELVAHVSEMGVPAAAASEYLDLLVKEQLLVSELEASVTGENHYNYLLKRLGGLCPENDMVAHLRHLKGYAKQAMAGLIPASALKSALGPLENGWSGKDIVQVDLRIGSTHNVLGKRARDTILREVAELLPLNEPIVPKQIQDFCRRFLARYGEREMPLMEVLDQDRGIGYGDKDGQYLDCNPLIKGLGLSRNNNNTDLHSHLSRSIYARYRELGGFSPDVPEIAITDLIARAPLKPTNRDLPLTGFVLGEILAPNGHELDSGKFRFNVMACGGPSALPLMARFSHLDPALECRLREIASWEEAKCKNAVMAEIVHLPEDRIGNIMQRPQLRRYEIPLLANCTVPDQSQIPLTDLYVSVKDGMVWLRSGSLDKYVIPRLSCAHNFRYGVTAYQFLCDLQFQSNSLDISWEWGALDGLPFLPRVIYKHLILSRAEWNIPKGSVDDLAKVGESTMVAGLRARFGLPGMVVLADADNELVLDLTNPFAQQILLERLKKGNAKLLECLHENGSPVSDMENRAYANEVILPFYTDSVIRDCPPSGNMDIKGDLIRSFPPGSEWLYTKIYCGERDADRILMEHLPHIIKGFKGRGLIAKWHFIRYRDPEAHIRLRFLTKGAIPASDYAGLMLAISESFSPLIASGIVHRLTFDTYEREIERYGERTMESCEEIFGIDSNHVLQMLPLFLRPGGEQTRWICAAAGIDDMLDAFGATTSEKLTMVDNWRDAFAHEFKVDREIKAKIDNRYRKFRSILEVNLLDHRKTSGTINNYRIERVAALENVFSDLGKWRGGKTGSILASLCHMYLNKVFFVNQRENEMVIYHFLGKFYHAQICRAEVECTV